MQQLVPQIEIFEENRLTKKQKRLLRKKNQQANQPTALRIKEINPLTTNQRRFFDAFDSNKNILATGCPGTGKTFLATYLGLDEILSHNSPYKKLLVIRSAVSGRNIGFLPGKPKDKLAVYEGPYQNHCVELFGRQDAYSILKTKGTIEFDSTSFLRGLTFSNTIVIIDECQNMSFQELHTIMTRYGENCKMIFCGDVEQCDLNKRLETSGLYAFMKILGNMKSFVNIDFQAEDIVRHGIVKDYILTKIKLEREGLIDIQS